VNDRFRLRTVGDAVRAGGSDLHQRLSVFWGTPATLRGRSSRGRFPPLLISRGTRRVTKVVLFPVRFRYTAATGRAGTNAAAAEHYLAGPSAPAAELVTAALAWRQEPPAGDAAASLLSRELVPLYVHYVDDHIARLDAAGSRRLADRFRRWRARLLA
jgi:hypothetical protein